MIKLIKFLLKRYLKRHPEWIASSISVDEQTEINILVAHYYADHWTYGTKTYEYEEKPLGEWGKWIPITFRQADDDEYEDFLERYSYIHIPREECKVYDCRMPDDGEEVLVTTSSGRVCEDTFCADPDAYGFEYNSDPDDVIAWMPKPKAYKKEEES